MDAEGLGRKPLLTPSGEPRKPPEKRSVGTVTASHVYKTHTLQALSSSLNAGSGSLSPETAASSKPTTEFAQPCLSRVKRRSSPARGYKFGCVRACPERQKLTN